MTTDENLVLLKKPDSRIVLLSAILMGLVACGSRSIAPGGDPCGGPEHAAPDPINPPFVRSFGGDPGTVLTSVAADQYGNIYLAGYYSGIADRVTLAGKEVEGFGKHDILVAKLDIEGNLVWLKTAGTGGQDEPYRIRVSNSGNGYVTGRCSAGTLTLGATNMECGSGRDFVASLDSSGGWDWARIVPWYPAMVVSPEGDLHLGGPTAPHENEFDGLPIPGNTTILAKIDAQGSTRWLTDLGGLLTPEPAPQGLSPWRGYLGFVDADGNSYLMGMIPPSTEWESSGSNGSVVAAVNPEGALVYKTIMGLEHLFGMDRDGSHYTIHRVYKYGNNPNNPYDSDWILGKRDPQGSLLWVQTLDQVRPGFITPGISGEVFMVGTFLDTIVVGDATLTSRGAFDVYVIKIDPSGSVVWARAGGGVGNDEPLDAAVDQSGRLIVVGVHSGGRFAETDLEAKRRSGFIWALEP